MAVENALDVDTTYIGPGFWCPERLMRAAIKSSSQAVTWQHETSRSSSPASTAWFNPHLPPRTRTGRSIWVSAD